MSERRSQAKVVRLEIYTDGSLKRLGAKATFGGWAYIVVRDGHEIYMDCGNEYDTTNQRMELLAIKNALEYAKEHRNLNEQVVIYSDSAYAINCYQQDWYINWQKNGWVNAKNQPIANQDLWTEIIPYFDNYWYHFSKVKGHDNNYWNIQCDKLAQGASEKIKFGRRGTNE